MNKDVVAVVLAGGIGRRFWPLTTDKSFFSFLGKTFIEHTVIDALPREINRIVFVANKNNYKYFQNLTLKIPHLVVTQQSPNGMADAILNAQSVISDASILVLIADHLVNKQLFQQILDIAKTRKVSGVMPGWKTDKYFPGGYLVVDNDRIKEIIEKPGEDKVPSHYVYVSGQYFDDINVLIDQIRKTTSNQDDIYEKALSDLAKHSEFIMVPYDGPSSSLKYSWNVLDVTQDLLNQINSSYRGTDVVIKQNVMIEGNVYIGNHVKIFENSKIVGPCYIGDNTIIGNNNMIRDSHIGSGCVTGFNTDITRSYIGNECWFHANYIGDSVLEGNVSLGSGSVLANLRLDEDEIFSYDRNDKLNTKRNKFGSIIGKNVRIGVNVSVMPGIKIGQNTFIGGGITVDRDIPDNSFVTQKHEIIIKSNQKQLNQNTRDQFKTNI
jgi:UDP-N-acetylglucosamine diphosphorylase / glucose-1-phosphate thymidylyltransferase / UDP-N-acetylgalactosamine diphosphorylase / glucosamine-1-phosphate N-acetyltransferase / galactosamine-1-phosphate N-acetyltransferase